MHEDSAELDVRFVFDHLLDFGECLSFVHLRHEVQEDLHNKRGRKKENVKTENKKRKIN